MASDTYRARINTICDNVNCQTCFETRVRQSKPIRKRVPKTVDKSLTAFSNAPRLVKATQPIVVPTPSVADIQAQVERMRDDISNTLDELLCQPAKLSSEGIVTNKDYIANPSMHIYMNHETEKHRR